LPRNLDEAYWALGPGDDSAVQNNPAVKITKRGCYQQPASFNTFRLPDEFIQSSNLPKQAYSAEILDEKALNCTLPEVFAAFCAWDDAYVPTTVEYGAAWGVKRFPWGDGPSPIHGTPVNPVPAFTDYVLWSPCLQENIGGAPVPYQTIALHYCTVADLDFTYRFPLDAQAGSQIAAPGRRPMGNGPYGHADLIGNLAPYLRNKAGGWGSILSSVGSWQGHFNTWDKNALGTLGNSTAPVWRTSQDTDTSDPKTAYWAAGARCARRLPH
jgi:hypothetical protein